MPVQINEVVIRAVVDSKAHDASGDYSKESSESSADDMLERILEIIQDSKER
ncbi:MAG: hypothetical protein HKK67_09365 [Chlorobiaceae bacterium]|nr:hypothetical protein [Chlorobiaceae bacterium]